MDENKNEILKSLANVEYYPLAITKEEARIESYTKLPLSNIAAVGVAFEPLYAAFQNVILGNSGASGLYKVVVPPGKRLVEFTNGSGFMGSISRGNNQVGGGQAILNPLICDPTMLFMAMAIVSINKKLDVIQNGQKEIIEFLEQKEKSKLRGNLNYLNDVLDNYKHNWENEKFLNNNHLKVLDIKQDSEQSILFYRDQIDKRIKSKSYIYSDKTVKDKLVKIQSEFKEYQLGLYLYSFASFLDVMLLENFESAFLDSIVDKIEDYAFQYRELYTECYDKIENKSKSSVESQLLKGISSANKLAGKAVSKIPVVSKTQIDETLTNAGDRLGDYHSKKISNTMEQLLDFQNSAVRPFIDNINVINQLYNNQVELVFDEDNLYIGLEEE